MKRKLSAILAIVLAMLMFSSCTLFEKITAYSLYSKAVKTIEQAGGYETDCDMTIALNLLGSEFSVPLSVNVKIADDIVQMTTDVGDSKMYTTVIDDTVYVDYDGEKIRYSTSSDSDTANKVAEQFSSYDIPTMAKELFDGIEVVVNDDKSKEITLYPNAEDIASLLNASSGLDGMTFENIVFGMKFTSDNVLNEMTLHADCAVEVMGVEVGGYVDAVYTFINFGEKPEIVLPSAYEEYTDGGEYTVE